MSENEKRKRAEYREKRNHWIMIQCFVLLGVLLCTIVFSILAGVLGKTEVIGYRESGTVDYTVDLKENEYIEDGELGQNNSYIASLIDKIGAVFDYKMCIDTDGVEYEYSYEIDAVLKIVDKTSGASLWEKTDELVPDRSNIKTTKRALHINRSVDVEYEKYDALAKEFIATYQLTNVTSSLVLRLNVEVNSTCDKFTSDDNNTYTSFITIPLNETTVNIQRNAPQSLDRNILAVTNSVGKIVFTVLAIVFGSLLVLGGAFLIVFTYFTRNADITYEIRVKRIISSYKSYIQKINNVFDTEGYQLLFVDTFREMLEIKDTIQSPILMNENEDKTHTLFLIPTNTKQLYIFEIKAEDYDQIYAEVEEEPVEEEEVVELYEEANEDDLAEALAAPDVALEDIDFVDEIDDEYEQPDEEHPGVEVIGVVWPERAHKNKIYRYDPNGHTVNDGDTVLVPSRDAHKNRDIIRKASVAHGNHVVDPETIVHPLKKVIGVVKHKMQQIVSKDDTNNKKDN